MGSVKFGFGGGSRGAPKSQVFEEQPLF